MMTKREAGSLGGRATVEKYGTGYMSEIGKRGYKVTRSMYDTIPYGVTEWAMVRKIDHVIVKIWR